MLALLRLNCCNNCCLSSTASVTSSINPKQLYLTNKRNISTGQLRDYLSILECNRNSTPKDIKESFLKLSKVYHPDNQLTGSHLKFVKLKEAYDALKDGPPTITSYSSTSPSSSYQSQSSSSSSAYRDYRSNQNNMNRSAHAFYKERQRQSESQNNYRFGYRFGGPFANSSTAWEDLKKHEAYRRSQQYGNSYGKSAMSTTIFFSAIAWIFVYSGALLVWEHNDRVKDSLYKYKPRNHADYKAYEEYVRRKETERILRSRLVNRNLKKKESEGEEEKVNNKETQPFDNNKNNIESNSNSIATSDKLPIRKSTIVKHDTEDINDHHENIIDGKDALLTAVNR